MLLLSLSAFEITEDLKFNGEKTRALNFDFVFPFFSFLFRSGAVTLSFCFDDDLSQSISSIFCFSVLSILWDNPHRFDLIKIKLAYVIAIVINDDDDDDDENRVGTVYRGEIHWRLEADLYDFMLLLLLEVGILCFAGVLRNDGTAPDELTFVTTSCDQSWFCVHIWIETWAQRRWLFCFLKFNLVLDEDDLEHELGGKRFRLELVWLSLGVLHHPIDKFFFFFLFYFVNCNDDKYVKTWSRGLSCVSSGFS